MAGQFLLWVFMLWEPGRLSSPGSFCGFFGAAPGNVLVCTPCVGEWLLPKLDRPSWALAGQNLGLGGFSSFSHVAASSQKLLSHPWPEQTVGVPAETSGHSPLPVSPDHWPSIAHPPGRSSMPWSDTTCTGLTISSWVNPWFPFW